MEQGILEIFFFSFKIKVNNLFWNVIRQIVAEMPINKKTTNKT